MEKKKKGIKFYLTILGNIIFYGLLLVLTIFSIANIQVKSETDIPSIFGKGFISILSGSMDGTKEDSFPKGSLVFIDMLDDAEKDALEVGDTIVFYYTQERIHVIHRIVYIDGETYVTQGDVNSELYGVYSPSNYNTSMELQFVTQENIIGSYTGSIQGIGDFIQETRTPNGFLLYIVLPLLLFFGFEGFILIKQLLQRNKEVMEQKHAEEKERLKQELLAELKKQNKQDE